MLSPNEVRLEFTRYLIGSNRSISADIRADGATTTVSSGVPAKVGRTVDFWRTMQEIGFLMHRARDGISCVVTLADLEHAPEFTFVPGGAFFPGRDPVHDGLLDVAGGMVPRLSMTRMRPGVPLVEPVLGLLVSGPGDFDWRAPGADFFTRGARISGGPYFQATPAEEISPSTTCQVYGLA